MPARTLLQHAVPTTFGAKAAGWLVAVVDTRRRLVALRTNGLAVQLGGAAGTLASLGEQGPEVLRLFAEELELAEPVVPWHTNRVRVAELGAALDVAAGVVAKIALDVALLAQTEVAEVTPALGGGSSTMPHKRNPVGSALASAAARQVHAYASVLTGGLAQEHERAIGAWHAEWRALTGALALTGGAAAAVRETLDGLEVDVDRMRRNLELTKGAIMTERVALQLAESVGRGEAHQLVRQALTDGRLGDLAPEGALDPATYLGSTGTFVDRALTHYREPS
jgi:3-carboxy-cis,cis-muconate cycloisomerase